MFLISSGDRRPNCISWIVRSGALEYVKLRFAMFTSEEITWEKSKWRSTFRPAKSTLLEVKRLFPSCIPFRLGAALSPRLVGPSHSWSNEPMRSENPGTATPQRNRGPSYRFRRQNERTTSSLLQGMSDMRY